MGGVRGSLLQVVSAGPLTTKPTAQGPLEEPGSVWGVAEVGNDDGEEKKLTMAADSQELRVKRGT